MSSELDPRLREAGEWDVGEAPVARIAARSAQRRRRRRVGSVAVALVVLAAIAATITVTTGDNGTAPPARVTISPPPALSWTELTPPPEGDVQVLTNAADGFVAITRAVNPSARPSEGLVKYTFWWTAPHEGHEWERIHEELPSGSAASPDFVEAAAPTQAFRTRIGLVVIGAAPRPHGTRSAAAIWISPDGRGRSWRRVDDPSFASKRDRLPENDLDVGSTLFDIFDFRGRVVILGEVFTDSDALAGVMSAVWTSRDGLRWKRQLVDLGDGFDPYFDSGAATDDGILAAGRMGKGSHTTIWRSSDLRQWDFAGDEPGAFRIHRARRGYVGEGTGWRQPKNGDFSARPTLWWSADGEQWQQIVRLARRDEAGATFGQADRFMLWVQSDGSDVHASRDGRQWSPVDTTVTSLSDANPAESPARVIGETRDAVYVAQGSRLWRVTRQLPGAD